MTPSFDMQDMGKFLVIAGALLILVGLVLWSGFGNRWLGRLPGDIMIQRESFKFYFPIVTCILLSAILSLIFWIIRKF